METWGKTSYHTLPMDKKNRLYYKPPKVVAVAFKVEEGLLVSRPVGLESELSPFGDASWDEPSSPSSTSHFGDGDWTGGSSFSTNSDFGSGSWD